MPTKRVHKEIGGTSILCMDGRSHDLVTKWMKDSFGLDYVDKITFPGMDKVLLKGKMKKVFKMMLDVSIVRHESRVITVVGHDDCAGNPVGKKEHLDYIVKGVKLVREWVKKYDVKIEVIGLWVEKKGDVWTVREVSAINCPKS